MFLYNNPLFVEFLEKKTMNKNLYGKFFVRHSYGDEHDFRKSLAVVDDNSSLGIIDFNLKYFQMNYFGRLRYGKGYSILLENFSYSKNQIQFNYFLFNSKRNFLDYIPLFFKKLRALRSSKKILVLINVKRGGFRCFFSGVCGFFPFKHFFSLIWLRKRLELESFFSSDSNFPQKRSFNGGFKKFLFYFFHNNNMGRKFYIKLKGNSNKEFKISFLSLLQKFLLFDKLKSHGIYFIMHLLSKEKFLDIFRNRFVIPRKLFNLNDLSAKRGSILPRSFYVFIFYKLKFRVKNNYYNFSMRNRVKFKRKKKLFFKSRVKLVFLSHTKSNLKKRNVLDY